MHDLDKVNPILACKLIKSDPNDHQEAIFKYLHNVYNEGRSLRLDVQSVEAMDLIKSYANKSKNIEHTMDLSEKYLFPSTLIKYISEEIELLKQELKKKPESVLDRKTLMASETSISIVRVFSNTCIDFCTDFVNQEGVKLLLAYLKNETLIETYIKLSASGDRPDVYKSLGRILRGAIGCLVNLSKVYCATKYNWFKNDENVMKFLQSLSNRLEKVNDCQLAIYIGMQNRAV
jgi:hypothetical protein